MEREKNHSFGGLAFVAFMFIGAGIGLLFRRPDAGGCIGMGIGFLAMGFIRVKNVKPSPIAFGLPANFGHIMLSVLGLIIIAVGLGLLFNTNFLYPYVIGIGIVIIGVFILISGLIKWHTKE